MKWALLPEEREQLRRRLQTTGDARECRRCSALLRLGEGRPAVSVAREFGVSRQTLHNWLGRFRSCPGRGLGDEPRSGRSAAWTDERVGVLERLLADPPRDHGFQAVGWTAGLLRARLRQLCRWEVSESSLRDKLHELDYVWKRFRYTLAPDPAREKKTAHP